MRRLLLAGLVVTMTMLAVHAADVLFFGITKGNHYFQGSPAPPVAVAGAGYEVHAFADLSIPNSLSSATVQWPRNGPVKQMANEGRSWDLREFFTSQVNLNFGAPNGTYQFAFETTSDGEKGSRLTLSADYYPVPVHIQNFAAAQEIDWRSNFTLTWPANSADFFRVQIFDEEAVVFETGRYPDAPDALPARANSVMIPANSLEEGRRYMTRVVAWVRSTEDRTSYPGALGWAAYTRTTDLPIQTAFAVNDVNWLALYRKQNFVQTSPAVPVLSSTAPFEIAGFAEASDPLTVINATVKFPNNFVQPLAALGKSWNWSQSFPSQQAMEAAFPSGNCDFSLQTLNNGLRQLTLPLASAVWPNQPHLNNWPAANRIQPGQPFNLTWHPITGATSDDFIQVILRQNGAVLFKTGDHPRAAGALPGTASMAVIPGELLRPGEVYQVLVLFLKAAHVDPFSYPRALAVTGQACETTALIRTRGGTHPQPRLGTFRREGDRMRGTIESAAPGWFYGLERSSDLKTWTNILLTNAPAESFEILLNQEPGPVFLRALVF